MESTVVDDEYLYSEGEEEDAKGGKVEWRDITASVLKAAKSFHGEELLHDANFSLMESMSALELCEPKMDPVPQPLPRVSTLLKMINIKELRPEEAVAAMRHLLRMEVEWLDGGDARKTILRSLWLRKPGLMALRRVLSVPCLAMLAVAAASLRIVQACRLAIVCADIYEEEDFGVTPNLDSIISLEETWELLRQASAKCGKEYIELGNQVRLRFFVLRALTALLAGHQSSQCIADLNACNRFLTVIPHNTMTPFNRQVFLLQIDAFPETAPENMYKEQFIEPMLQVAKMRQYLESTPNIQISKVTRLITQLQLHRIVPRSLAALEIGSEALRQQRDATQPLVLGRHSYETILFGYSEKKLNTSSKEADFRELASIFMATMLRERCLAPSRLHTSLLNRLLPDCAHLKLLAAEDTKYTCFVFDLALQLSALYLDTLLELDLLFDLVQLEQLFAYQVKIFTLHKDTLAPLRLLLADGLKSLATALLPSQRRRLVPRNSSSRLNFNAHFKVLDQVLSNSPAHMTYDQFNSDAQLFNTDPLKLLDLASNALMLAKIKADNLLESEDIDKTEVVALTKVAIANRVVAAKALRRLSSSDQTPADPTSFRKRLPYLDLDHRFHRALPVLRDPEEAPLLAPPVRPTTKKNA